MDCQKGEAHLTERMPQMSTSRLQLQIISRYAPAPNRSGPLTYLFDLMAHLASNGFDLELVILDAWFDEHRLDAAVRNMASVSILRLAPPTTLESPFSLKSLLRPLYRRLPEQLMIPARSAWYRIRNKPLPGIHPHDAPATPEEQGFVAERIAAFQPQVVLANHTCLGNLFENRTRFQGSLTAILTHHIESQRTNDFQQARLAVAHDSAWNAEQEQALLRHADVLIAIQRDDAEMLRRMAPQAEIVVAPMSAKFIAHHEGERIQGRCLFVGSNIDHNAHGMAWFLRDVWPRVVEQEPQATLHVCGTVCESLQAFAAPNVRLLGRVDDLNAEYGAAEVCVIPLIAGSGLKIKLIEALSHGRACVATSVGVQGVQELTDRAVLVADAPEAFAERVISLLQHSEKRTFMEEEARKYVDEHLTPEKAYQPFINFLHNDRCEN